MESTNSYTHLRDLIAQYFKRAELESLSYDLGIDFEEISGVSSSKSEIINRLLRSLANHARQAELIAALRKERPHVTWPETYDFPSGTLQENGAEILDEAKWQAYLAKYLARLEKQVGRVRVLGRRQAESLENIYTHVNVLDKPTAERRYDIPRLSEEDSPRDFYSRKSEKRISGEEAVAAYDKLFVLGKPGAGKTTFLKHTALRAINGEIEKTPIFVTLKELSDSGQEIIPFIVRDLGLHRFANAEAFMEQWLADGQALVLFDGLDEVNLEDNHRLKLTQALNSFVKQFSASAIFITCRVTANGNTFDQFQYVEMADFNDKQIRHFIERWFAGDKQKGRDCKKALLEDKETEAVRELAQVPLLLSLICVVFEEGGEIPANRHELYEEATKALLVEWDESRSIERDQIYEGLSLEHKKGLLAYIAFKTFKEGDYFLAEKKVISLIEAYLKLIPGLEKVDGKKVLQAMNEQHGIFVERARCIHSFSHLTLQEYFTSRYIVDNEQRRTLPQLMQHIGKDRWNEVFKLTAGLLECSTEFFKQYLIAMRFLLKDDSQLLVLLNWAKQKSVTSNIT